MSFSLSELKNDFEFNILKDDLKAGFIVGAVGFPQSMAYALIAGVNPVYGLYTSAVAAIVSTFTDGEELLIVGPTNIMALAVASSLNFLQGNNYLQGVFLLTLLVGIIQILLGVLKLGELVNYVSHSVIVGIMTGVAVIITISQLGYFLGMDVEMGSNIFMTLYEIVSELNGINYYALFTGVVTLAVLLIIQNIDSRYPSYIIATGIAMLVVYLFGLEDFILVVDDFKASAPNFVLVGFDYSLIPRLLSPAMSIALLGFIHVVSVVKDLEKKTRVPPKINREFTGQGIVNIASAFCRGFAVTGSFTRTSLNYEWGAKTRISGFISGLVTVAFFVLLTPVIGYIPIPALSVIVVLVIYRITDWEEIILIFKTGRFDSLIFIVTFLTTVISTRLDYAIYFGVFLSFILVLKNSSNISYTHYDYNGEKEDTFSRQPLKQVKENDCIIINLAGTLHFNCAENLKNELNESFREDKVFVVRMREIEDIDLTSIEELDKFIEKVKKNGGKVILSGVSERMYNSLKEYGIIEKLNDDNIFTGENIIFASTREAVARAEDEIENGKD